MSEFEYRVQSVLSMYDGDSVNVRVVRKHDVPERIMDFGFDDVVVIPGYTIMKEIEVAVRMYGFDTPELRDKRHDWKAAAYLARDVAREWMKDSIKAGPLVMETYKDRTGKYGRYLANFRSMNGTTLGDYLIQKCLAVPYYGQNKTEVEAAHQANINALKKVGEI